MLFGISQLLLVTSQVLTSLAADTSVAADTSTAVRIDCVSASGCVLTGTAAAFVNVCQQIISVYMPECTCIHAIYIYMYIL